MWVLQHLLNSLLFVERVIHIFYTLCLFWTHAQNSLSNSSSSARWSFNISLWHFLFPFHMRCALKSFAWGLLQKPKKKHAYTVVGAPVAHTLAHTLAPRFFHTPASCLFTLHPSVWGQLCAPLSSQWSHTHSAKPHSSLSAPASLMFLTVPQCPPSTGLQRPVFLWERIAAIFLFYLFHPLPTLVTRTLFILWLRTQFKSPFLHQSHATQLLSPYLLECPFYSTSGHHNTPINSTVSVLLPTETCGLSSSWKGERVGGVVAMKKYYSLLLCMSLT